MNIISEMLNLRKNVLFDTAREDMVNLTGLAENRINVNKFIGENFQPQGITLLFTTESK